MSSVKTIAGIDYLDSISDSTHRNRPAIIFLHGWGDNCYGSCFLHNLITAEADWYFPDGLYPLSSDKPKARSWFPENVELMQHFTVYQQQAHSTDFDPRGFADILNHTLERLAVFVADVLKSHTNVILAGFSQGAMFLPHLASRFKKTTSDIINSER